MSVSSDLYYFVTDMKYNDIENENVVGTHLETKKKYNQRRCSQYFKK